MSGTPQGGGGNETMVWLLAGCAVLLVLGLCGATGVGVWMYVSEPAVAVPMPPPTPPPAPPTWQPQPPTGPGPQLPPPVPGHEPPRTVTAVVTSVSGRSPVVNGATCGFSVERRPNGGGYWCRTQIVCGGQTLYGDSSQNGFFPCTLHESPRRDVVGTDTETTSQDTDAAMTLDTQRNILRVSDDASGRLGAFTIEARITDVR